MSIPDAAPRWSGPGLHSSAQGGRGLDCHEGIPGLWECFWCNCHPRLEMAMSPVGWVVPRLGAALPFPEQNVGQPQSQSMSTESGEPELYRASRCFGKTRTIAVVTRSTRAYKARHGVARAGCRQSMLACGQLAVSGRRVFQRRWLHVCLSVYLSVYPSVRLSIYLSVCLSIYLSVCLSVCV